MQMMEVGLQIDTRAKVSTENTDMTYPKNEASLEVGAAYPIVPELATCSTTEEIDVKSKKKSDMLLGIFFLFWVIVIWNGCSYLTVFVYTESNTPYFLTWLQTSTFALNIPFIYFIRYIQKRRSKVKARRSSYTAFNAANEVTNPDDGQYISENVPTTPPSSTADKKKKLAIMQAFKAACVVAPFWFSANFAYNLSLSLTSVSSSTLLCTTSGLFTCLLAVFMGAEKLNKKKFFGVLLNLGGAILVALVPYMIKDNKGSKSTTIGDLVAVLSALLYAVYCNLMTYMLPEDKDAETGLFFGFVGVINIIIFSIGFIPFHYAGWEDYSFLTFKIVGIIIGGAIFNNAIADYFWARSMLLTSPTIATLGISLTIPAPLVIDAIINKSFVKDFLWCKVIGAVLIVTGFVCVYNNEESIDNEDREETSNTSNTETNENKVVVMSN